MIGKNAINQHSNYQIIRRKKIEKKQKTGFKIPILTIFPEKSLVLARPTCFLIFLRYC